MTLHKAKKVVIITERLISENVCTIIDDSDASGYTMTSVGGKGSRNIRARSEGASVVGSFSNIKIEVIVSNESIATELIENITSRFFQNYSGIAYAEDVEVLRLSKFLDMTDKED